MTTPVRALVGAALLLGTVASACAAQVERASDENASTDAEPSCNLDRAKELEAALWQRYTALRDAGCVSAPDGAGCADRRAELAAAVAAYFDCIGARQFQPLCETLERTSQQWQLQRAQSCNPPPPDKQAWCDGLEHLIGQAQGRIPEVCAPWPTEGECSAPSRAASIAKEQELVSRLVQHGCLSGDVTSEACAAAYQEWTAVKATHARCNSARNNETLCSYFTRKKKKADGGIAEFCSPSPSSAAPAPFPTWDGYCGYLRLHSSYYAERIAAGCY